MKRKIPNWIEGFYDYTAFLPSPDLFRKWCAISAIAGALERKVWVHTQGSDLYPNLYVILVAPPGVGKSILTKRVEALWQSLDGHYVASSNITKAALVDELYESVRSIVRPREVPATVNFNSIKILSNELGVLLPQYDGEFMATLTDIYDGSRYAERRRGAKDGGIVINRPQFNILTGTTPSHLKDFLPAGAFDQGFLSRSFLIYSGEVKITELFDVAQGNSELFKDLQVDFKNIAKLYGQIKFDPDAKAAISAWHMSGRHPKPEHPKLTNYNTRRTLHLLKLCMIASVAASDELIITVDHYQTALNWLIEAETFMPDIFKAMSSGGDSKVLEECWFFCMQYKLKTKKPVPERYLYNFLKDKLPAHSIERVIEIMVKANLLKVVMQAGVGKLYDPRDQVQQNS